MVVGNQPVLPPDPPGKAALQVSGGLPTHWWAVLLPGFPWLVLQCSAGSKCLPQALEMPYSTMCHTSKSGTLIPLILKGSGTLSVRNKEPALGRRVSWARRQYSIVKSCWIRGKKIKTEFHYGCTHASEGALLLVLLALLTLLVRKHYALNHIFYVHILSVFPLKWNTNYLMQGCCRTHNIVLGSEAKKIVVEHYLSEYPTRDFQHGIQG